MADFYRLVLAGTGRVSIGTLARLLATQNLAAIIAAFNLAEITRNDSLSELSLIFVAPC
jgi:hypothetical protein